MKRTFICGGVTVKREKLTRGALVVEDGRIAEVGYTGEIPSGADVIDAKGCYLLPGFVETHVHGGGGYDYMDGTAEAFHAVSAIHRKHGVTTVLPTTVACSFDAMTKVFETYRNAAATDQATVNYGGLHLEGPFISVAMKGAQNPKYIRVPAPREVDAILDAGGDIIRRCTVAPEIEGIPYLAKRMTARGIALSSGHSNAVYADITRGYELGIRHITHMYSNTPSVRKIDQTVYAGVIEAAYTVDGISVELIGDGHHVPAEVLRMALKIKGADKINLASDAMRAAGTDVTESYLGERKPENRVIVEDGVAKLPDRSFYAGSIATGDVMLKWAVETCGVSLCDASKLLSLSPARLVGLDKRKGSLEVGKDADVIFVDARMNVTRTFLSRDFQ